MFRQTQWTSCLNQSCSLRVSLKPMTLREESSTLAQTVPPLVLRKELIVFLRMNLIYSLLIGNQQFLNQILKPYSYNYYPSFSYFLQPRHFLYIINQSRLSNQMTQIIDRSHFRRLIRPQRDDDSDDNPQGFQTIMKQVKLNKEKKKLKRLQKKKEKLRVMGLGQQQITKILESGKKVKDQSSRVEEQIKIQPKKQKKKKQLRDFSLRKTQVQLQKEDVKPVEINQPIQNFVVQDSNSQYLSQNHKKKNSNKVKQQKLSIQQIFEKAKNDPKFAQDDDQNQTGVASVPATQQLEKYNGNSTKRSNLHIIDNLRGEQVIALPCMNEDIQLPSLTYSSSLDLSKIFRSTSDLKTKAETSFKRSQSNISTSLKRILSSEIADQTHIHIADKSASPKTKILNRSISNLDTIKELAQLKIKADLFQIQKIINSFQTTRFVDVKKVDNKLRRQEPSPASTHPDSKQVQLRTILPQLQQGEQDRIDEQEKGEREGEVQVEEEQQQVQKEQADGKPSQQEKQRLEYQAQLQQRPNQIFQSQDQQKQSALQAHSQSIQQEQEQEEEQQEEQEQEQEDEQEQQQEQEQDQEKALARRINKQNQGQQQPTTRFRKLRNYALIYLQKKKKNKQKRSPPPQNIKSYFDEQAQLGSDNQQNDNQVKKINREEQAQQQDDQDSQLQQFIDKNAFIIMEDEEQAYKHFLQKFQAQDKFFLQKALNARFKVYEKKKDQINQLIDLCQAQRQNDQQLYQQRRKQLERQIKQAELNSDSQDSVQNLIIQRDRVNLVLNQIKRQKLKFDLIKQRDNFNQRMTSSLKKSSSINNVLQSKPAASRSQKLTQLVQLSKNSRMRQNSLLESKLNPLMVSGIRR